MRNETVAAGEWWVASGEVESRDHRPQGNRVPHLLGEIHHFKIQTTSSI